MFENCSVATKYTLFYEYRYANIITILYNSNTINRINTTIYQKGLTILKDYVLL